MEQQELTLMQSHNTQQPPIRDIGSDSDHPPPLPTTTDSEELEEPPGNLDAVEEILGYKFKDKSLLEQAFTHISFCSDDNNNNDTAKSDDTVVISNERLEYVGDAVLNLLITNEQYFAYPALTPGALTQLRAANVDTEKLARVAIKHRFHRYLRHKKPLLLEKIRQFTQAIQEYPLHSNGLIEVPKSLADVVEATIGAVFIDSGSSIDTAWKVFRSLLEPIICPETIGKHPVTELYEVCQKKNLKVKFVDLWKESMAFDVFVEDQLMGRGIYGLKKEIAHNRAAKVALDKIGKVLSERENIIDDGYKK